MIKDSSRAVAAEIEARFRKSRSEDRSLWSLVESIHSAPGLREKVTLESQPLCPVIEMPAGGREAQIHVLLAVPDGREGFQPPWALVTWNWPSRRWRSIMEIQDRLDPVETPLPAQLRCTREFAGAAETALAQGTVPPAPPAPIPDLIRQALGREVAVGVAKPATAPEAPPAKMVPVMLAGDLPLVLEKTERLLHDLSAPGLEQEWRRIYGRLATNRFSVAVVGERSRGKSTLINQLLGHDLLPVGGPERKPSFVEITASEEPVLQSAAPGDEQRKWAVSGDGFQAALKETAGSVAALRAGVSSDWLRETGLRLIEIPGPDDLGEGAALDQVVDILSSVDAALVVVSATMALSLTEKAFVESQILARQVPRVAVVLTHLDTIGPRDRKEVLDFVRQKIATWGPDIPFCIPHSVSILPPGVEGVTAGIDRIRRIVAAWAGSDENKKEALVHRQVAESVRRLLGLARAHLEVRKRAASLEKEERDQRLTEARRALDARKIDWEELRLAMEQKQLQASQWLDDKMRQVSRGIVTELLLQLRRSGNPKEWWDRDFPVLVRRDLERAESALSGNLKERLTADERWLIKEVERRFSRRLGEEQRGELVDLEIPGAPRAGDDFADLQKMRWVIRGGSIVATCIIGLSMSYMSVMLGGGALILGEMYVRWEAHRQQEKLAPDLLRLVNEIVDKGLDGAHLRLKEAYMSMVDAVQREQEAWHRVERKALEQPTAPNELAEIERRLADLRGIEKELAV